MFCRPLVLAFFFFFLKKRKDIYWVQIMLVLLELLIFKFFSGVFLGKGFHEDLLKSARCSTTRIFGSNTSKCARNIYICSFDMKLAFYFSAVVLPPCLPIYIYLYTTFIDVCLWIQEEFKKKMKNTHDKNSVNNSIIIRHMLPVPCIGTPYCHTMQKPLISKKAQFPVWISDAIIE